MGKKQTSQEFNEGVKNEVAKVDIKASLEEVKIKISLLDAEFGREDLNALRDKINEVIKFVNK